VTTCENGLKNCRKPKSLVEIATLMIVLMSPPQRLSLTPISLACRARPAILQCEDHRRGDQGDMLITKNHIDHLKPKEMAITCPNTFLITDVHQRLLERMSDILAILQTIGGQAIVIQSRRIVTLIYPKPTEFTAEMIVRGLLYADPHACRNELMRPD